MKKLIAGSLIFFGSLFCCDEKNIISEAERRFRNGVNSIKSGLECDDILDLTYNGSTFYACEEDMDSNLESKLKYISAVKKYGKESLGLDVAENYLVYRNGKTDKVDYIYILYVTPKFLIPKEGGDGFYLEEDTEYRKEIKKNTFFWSKIDDLMDEAEYYDSKGYDVTRRSTPNFMGCDISPEFLESPLSYRTSTIFHEDWHTTVEARDLDRNLEESIATFIGKVSAIEFTKNYFGKDSEEHINSKERFGDWIKFSNRMNWTRNRLEELYRIKGITEEERLSKKKQILSLSGYALNNSGLWMQTPYTKNFPLVCEVYKSNPKLGDLVKILKNIPADEKKGIKYLKGFVKKK